jgi:hypothetical protein
MTILNSISSPSGRRLVTTTVLLGTIGFLCGFLLALTLSVYSLYSCTEIL